MMGGGKEAVDCSQPCSQSTFWFLEGVIGQGRWIRNRVMIYLVREGGGGVNSAFSVQ
jgi:hypothetical protein